MDELSDSLKILEKEKTYWINKLAGDTTMSGFFPDHKVSNQDGYQTLLFPINKTLVDKMKELANHSEYAIFTIFVTGVNVLLSKYTNNHNVTIGMPMFKTENMDSHQYHLLKTSIDPELSFKEALLNTRKSIVEADDNKRIPISQLFEIAGLPMEDKPRFNTLIFHSSIHDIERVEITNAEVRIGLVVENDKMSISISWALNKFCSATVQKWVEQLSQVLVRSISQPSIQISKLDFINSKEREDLTFNFNQTEANFDVGMTLHQLFEKQAAWTPDRIAAVFSSGSLTYRELNTRANKLASTLRSKGVGPDKPVAILVERSAEMMIGILAVLKAGGAYVPLDINYPTNRIQYLLQDCGAGLLLTCGHVSSPKLFMGEQIDLLNEAAFQGDGVNLPGTAGPDNLAYIIYTSGSTGNPKGVMIEHRSVINRIQWMQKRFPLSADDVIIQKTPVSFDVSVWELFWWGISGASAVFLEPGAEKNPGSIIECVNDHRVTVMHFVPSMLHLFLDHVAESEAPQQQLKTLRRVFTSGEALQSKQAARFGRLIKDTWGTELVNLYGPTEATVDVSYHECTCNEDEESIPIGKPIDNTFLYVLDNQQSIQPIGVPGELYISGVGLARGYLNQPELTEERFIKNPFVQGELMYRTGDLARWLPSGEVEYLGRIDHQVKVRGYRIELGEIETCLLRQEKVHEAAVIVREIQAGMKDLCAYFVADDNLNTVEIKNHLTERLPSYMVPAHFMKLKAMPLTPNGKLDHKALPVPESHRERETYVSPRTNTERQIAEVWQEVMDLKAIGIDERYQDIGGDSMKSIRILYFINKIFKSDLKLLDFYQYATIRTLAGYLDKNRFVLNNERLQEAHEWLENWRIDMINSPFGATLQGREIEDFYPLSDIQEGMIFHSISQPEDQLYHEQFIYEFEDKSFSETKLIEALERMVQKHSIMRTTFNVYDYPDPIQLVQRLVQLDVEVSSLEHLTKEAQTTFLISFLEEDRSNPFLGEVVSASPMWRMRVYRLDEQRYCLVWIYHHAILDGWSNASFITELSQVYENLKQGDTKFELLRNSYKDLLLDQWIVKHDPEVLIYWQQELKNYRRFQSPFLPEVNQQNSFLQSKFTLSSDVNKSLIEQTATKYSVSIKTILFTAYACMMNMFDADNDFVVGMVVNNRPFIEDGDKILGCFLNSLPIRLNMKEILSWQELLATMDKKLAEAHQYGRLPLSRIQQAINENTSEMLFDNIFNYVDLYVYNELSLQSQNDQSLNNVVNYERTNAMLQFDCFTENEHINIVIGHVTEIYPKANVIQMINYFEQILMEMVKNPEMLFNKTMFLAGEQLLTLRQWSEDFALSLPEDKTICGLFEAQVQSSPDKIALIIGSSRVTYTELNEKVDKLARQLAIRSVGTGQIVGIMLGRSQELIIGLLAILKSGAAYLPIDPLYPEERIRHMLIDSGAALLLTQEESTIFSGETLNLSDESLFQEEVSVNSIRSVTPNDLAYCIYTSGSTGLPKGVLIEHRAVINLLAGIENIIAFQESKRILSVTTVSFDIFILETLLPLLKGMCVVMADAEEQNDPALLGKLMLREGVHMLQATPSRIGLILDNIKGAEGISKLTEIMIGGEAFGIELVHKLRNQTKAQIFNMYGPTETTVWSMVADLTRAEEVTLGSPIANTEIFIMDRGGQIQPFGTAGELCIAGAGLARGYHSREEMTKSKFVSHPLLPNQRMYRTGDLARWEANGDVIYLGRLDHQVKIRGYRVETKEIEHMLMDHPGVNSSVVLSRKREDEVYLVAYYLGEEEIPFTILREYLIRKLPVYMIPSFFVRLEHYPLLPNGKINHSALPSPSLERSRVSAGFRIASNAKELRLAELWQEVQGQSVIGMDETFFEMGGSSISLIRYHAKLETVFPNQISVADLFAFPTISKLAFRLDQEEKKSQVTIQTLNLPENSLVNDEVNEMDNGSLRFTLDSDITIGIHGLARQYEVDSEDVLLSAGIYVFKEITERSVVAIQAMTQQENEVVSLEIDFKNVKDFKQLFKSVSSHRTEGMAYDLREFSPLISWKTDREVAPLIYNQAMDKFRERLSRVFRFTLGYTMEDDMTTFTCEFDSNVIGQNFIEDWIAGYVRLLRFLTEQLLEEAVQK
ncbi:surfactin family lipopeptide synthetase A/fengycin family lipopeptide synthetase D [Paenibacillus sp. CF095]|uniref:non-ribosomal peptide synthetase n=1 Tax=Paenibacillus sp. CF095 TaxID=1881033 RepID=UPI0008919B3E|nr:non-ribosomal peptide synthetase [Paenibacillus sp. CF095]SDD50751.1 surfactin family lipopeptide synthetase A/fengycin family lipopeptide synthetase D [Paenibacillus sp. CF095]